MYLKWEGGDIDSTLDGAHAGLQTAVVLAGVESGAIPDAAITASSTYGPQCAPPTARLAYNANEKKDDLLIFVYDCDDAA